MKVKQLIIILLVVGLLGGGYGFRWAKVSQLAVSPNDSGTKPFVINKGASVTQIANNLSKGGFIRDPLLFKFFVRFRGLEKKLAAGEYVLSPSFNLNKTIEVLSGGPKDVWVTLPEGLRKEEIAIRIKQALNFESSQFEIEKFLDGVNSPSNAEGYLFPDTYLFPKSASESAIIAKLKNNFEKKTKDVLAGRKNGLTELETIILASLLEREVRTYGDKTIVAGIMLKRISSSWTLDVDATLEYAKATEVCLARVSQIKDEGCKWWDPALARDKAIVSPFNTYRNLGFPPSPISNPGLDSIKAAANPESSTYWFYLSDREGVTHFAGTLEEHQANINKYLR